MAEINTDGCIPCARKMAKHKRKTDKGGKNWEGWTPKQTSTTKETKRYNEPIWTKEKTTHPKPTTTLNPVPTSGQPLPKASIINVFGSTTGEVQLELNSDNTVKQGLDLMDGHVHEAYTQTAFLMNNNGESEMVLSADAQRFDESFDRLNANKNAGSEETISKEEFFAFLTDYSREVVESGEEGNAYRNKAAVHLDENNKQELSLAFEAIAGENKLIEKQEFIEFWDELLKNGEQYVDEKTGKTLTKVTGEQLNELVNKRLEAKGELPTFRKTEEEVKQMQVQHALKEKENELKNLKVNVNPDFVSKIEYSKNKAVSFITLDDGTEIQIQRAFNKDVNGVQITKEGDRYVITNNSSKKLDNKDHSIKIVPSSDSKITLRDCSGVTFSSPGELNDDILVEGTAEKINLNVGGGIDKYVNKTDIATTKDEIRIIKDAFNTSIKLRSDKDITVAHNQKTHNSKTGKTISYYYSASDDDTKTKQRDALEKTEKTLNKLNDMDLLKVALFGSVEDAGDISNEELLQKAKENGYNVNEQPVLLSKDERKNLNEKLTAKNIDTKDLTDVDLIKQYIFANSKSMLGEEINTDEKLLEYAQDKFGDGKEIPELTTDILVQISRTRIVFTYDIKNDKTVYLSAKDRNNIINEYIKNQKNIMKEKFQISKKTEKEAVKIDKKIDEMSQEIITGREESNKIEKQLDKALNSKNPNEETIEGLLFDYDEKLTETYITEGKLGDLCEQ